MNTQESNLSRAEYGGFTECSRMERIRAGLRPSNECRPGRFLPGLCRLSYRGNAMTGWDLWPRRRAISARWCELRWRRDFDPVRFPY
jgi:hypothetical protein